MTAVHIRVGNDRLQAVSRRAARPPVVNLLDDLDGLASRLSEAVTARDALDAYLLAAGMNQVTEDFLHRDVLMLGRVAATVRALPGPAGALAEAASQALRRLGMTLRQLTMPERSAWRWHRTLDGLTRLLAGNLAGTSAWPIDGEIEALARQLVARLPALPCRLRRTILRMPTCFQSLDQRPSDCALLVERFAARWPDRNRPLRVVGLRTSGSYLAPLVAAYLRQGGYRDVLDWTVRPSDHLFRRERHRLETVLVSDGQLLVVDDPPKSGASLVAAVRWLEQRGLPRSRVVMLVPLLGSAATEPPSLTGYPTVVLPWTEWSIHRALEPGAVRETLQEMLTGRVITAMDPGGDETELAVSSVVAVDRLKLAPIADLKSGSPTRRHVRALYRVRVEDERGRPHDLEVYVKGIGQGYFGRHSLTVARSLESFVPETYGAKEGLLFRSWLPDVQRVDPRDLGSLDVEPIAGYILARRGRLAVGADLSERMVGLNPVWQRVADVLAAPFGRGRSLVRPLTHAAARRLLRVDQPSVIDGSMAGAQWFRRPGSDRLLKVDYDERAYSNQDTVIDQLYSFDAAFDLASAAAEMRLSCPEDGASLAVALRKSFAARSGPIPAERWLLYQLLMLKSHRQFLLAMQSEFAEGTFPELPAEVRALLEPSAIDNELERLRRIMSRLDQEYWSETLLAGLDSSRGGAVCAIDIDGVLETDRLGYSSLTPLGALCIRALIAHGYQPVLTTGRSVDDVRDRCRSLNLAGGVAEYGAAYYDTRTDRVGELLSPAQRENLERLRSELASLESVHVAAGYTRIVRAHLPTRDGPKPLPKAMVEQLLDRLGLSESVRTVDGSAQTDFVAAGTDKARGLQPLLGLIKPEGGIALAAGDGAEDLCVLRQARLAVAPANAEPAVLKAGVRVMRGRYQAGLAQGVALLVGHGPGRCSRCRPASTGADAALLLTALRGQEDGKLTKLRQAARLALEVVRA